MNLWLQFFVGLPCIMAMGLFCSLYEPTKLGMV